MAASNPKRVCWDACAWIALIQKERIRDSKGAVTEDRYGLCRVVIELAEKGRVEIVTSGLSLAEVCRNPGIKSGISDQVGPYFENSWVLVVPVDTFVGTVARTLMMAGHAGLKPPDAVHLATAIVANADELHTFDQRLLGLDEQLPKQDGNMLKICRPTVATTPAPLLESPALAIRDDEGVDDTAEAADAGLGGEPAGEDQVDGPADGVPPKLEEARTAAGGDRASESASDEDAEEPTPVDPPATNGRGPTPSAEAPPTEQPDKP